MASIRYFSDVAGEAVQLQAIHGVDNDKFAALWPGIKGMRSDGFQMLAGHPTTGNGGVMPVTRKIEYKSQPSRHECNAKCMGGKINGTCECQCGGKNHGAGMFSRLVAEVA